MLVGVRGQSRDSRGSRGIRLTRNELVAGTNREGV
jgi:hypothetical protein